MHTGRTTSDPGSEAEPQRLFPLWKKLRGLQPSLWGTAGPESTPSFLLPEVVLLAAARPSPLLPLCPAGPFQANRSATDVQGDPNLKRSPAVGTTRPASRWTMAAAPGTPRLQLPEGHAPRRSTEPMEATASLTLADGGRPSLYLRECKPPTRLV